jgi:hypothetical protein
MSPTNLAVAMMKVWQIDTKGDMKNERSFLHLCFHQCMQPMHGNMAVQFSGKAMPLQSRALPGPYNVRVIYFWGRALAGLIIIRAMHWQERTMAGPCMIKVMHWQGSALACLSNNNSGHMHPW